jgi:hypothetical protein
MAMATVGAGDEVLVIEMGTYADRHSFLTGGKMGESREPVLRD